MSLADVIQLGASLVAVLFVAWLVGKLGLGADPRIADDVQAIRLAEDAEAGFNGIEVARDRAGFAAIVRNAGGRQMLVRAHGNHFAARPIDAQVIGRLDKDFLTLTMPERSFGSVTLHLGKDAGMWASRMRSLNAAAPARSPTRPPISGYSVGGRVGERAGAGFPSSEGTEPRG